MKDLQQLYDQAFEQALKDNANRGYLVSDGVKEYTEDTGVGKFYLCGWVYIQFKLNTCAGRDLKRELENQGIRVSHGYPSGFQFKLVRSQYSNGYYEIDEIAANKVATYLKDMGYPVSVWSQLD